jgi:hypothetical protein
MWRVLFQLEDVPDDFQPELPEPVRCANFTSTLAANMDFNVANRCFFTTDSGWMGLGPCHAKPGDVLVILYGGALCFVLRARGPHLQLIGDAYVQGAMRGECVDGSTTAEEFVLC